MSKHLRSNTYNAKNLIFFKSNMRTEIKPNRHGKVLHNAHKLVLSHKHTYARAKHYPVN
jgi:hypothetical protein